jgi:hypothetical protein
VVKADTLVDSVMPKVKVISKVKSSTLGWPVAQLVVATDCQMAAFSGNANRITRQIR